MQNLSIQQYSLHHLDIPSEHAENVPLEEGHNDLETYVRDLVDEILTLKKGRYYRFVSEDEVVPSQILKMGEEGNWNESSEIIAQKLIREEVERQRKVDKIAEIKKGSLLQILASHDQGRIVLLIKIDHEKIVDANALSIRAGLPIKKDRVQKSCLTRFLDGGAIDDVIISDSNSVISEYWWNNFLKCEELKSSQHNTKSAYSEIDNLLRRKVMRSYPADYHYLKNDINSYFANNDGFVFDEVVDLIKRYKPEEVELSKKVDKLVEDLEKLPDKGLFDRQFDLDTTDIRSKIRHKVVLAENFELRMNGDVPNLNSIVVPDEDDQGKFIKIYSERGYNEFKRDRKKQQ